MHVRLLGRVAIVLAMVAVTSIVGGTAASALPGLSYLTGQSALDSSSAKSVSLYCPAGTTVQIGAGGYVTGGNGEVMLTGQLVSQWINQPLVIVRAAEDADGYAGNWQLTVTAVCAPRPSGFTRVATWYESGSPGTATAACPIGTSLIGTSFWHGNNNIKLNGLVPTANGDAVTLTGSASRIGPAQSSISSTLQAQCATTPAGYQVVAAASNSASTPARTAAAKCPTGTRVHGTGAAVAGATDAVVIDGIAIDPATDTVTASAREDQIGTADNWSVRAYAICAN